MSRTTSAILAAIVVALCASHVNAAVNLVTTRAGLAGTDSIDWGALGPEYTAVPNPSAINSVVNLVPITVAQAGGGFLRVDQATSWAGNFAPGDELIWSQGGGPITIDFGSTFVTAFGLQIQADYFGNFTAQLDVFAGFVSEGGVSTSGNDNSAIFIGITSDTPFNQVVISLTSATLDINDFAVNQADFVADGTGAVPEATSLAVWGVLAITGACVRGVRGSRRKSTA